METLRGPYTHPISALFPLFRRIWPRNWGKSGYIGSVFTLLRSDVRSRFEASDRRCCTKDTSASQVGSPACMHQMPMYPSCKDRAIGRGSQAAAGSCRGGPQILLVRFQVYGDLYCVAFIIRHYLVICITFVYSTP